MKLFNQNLKSVAAILTMVLSLSACWPKEDPIAPPLDDNSKPSAAIINAAVVEKNGNTLRLKLDIAVFKDSKNIEIQLKPGQFVIDTLRVGGNTVFNRAAFGLSSAKSFTNYSALMLMDQSGSISSTDPQNFRLDAAKTFCLNLGSGNDLMLWSFAGSTFRAYGTGFSSDTSAVIGQIESLRNREGGSTPLYISQMAAIDFVSVNGTAAGKAVLTFTDGEDTQGRFTSDQVAANAQTKDVRLFNIGLGNVGIERLSRQAIVTEGAFMFAKDARQLISMFGNLGKLLDGSARFYQTEWLITRANNFGNGTMTHQIRILLPYGNEELLVPFSFSY